MQSPDEDFVKFLFSAKFYPKNIFEYLIKFDFIPQMRKAFVLGLCLARLTGALSRLIWNCGNMWLRQVLHSVVIYTYDKGINTSAFSSDIRHSYHPTRELNHQK